MWHTRLLQTSQSLGLTTLFNFEENSRLCCNNVLHSTTSQLSPFNVSKFVVLIVIFFCNSLVALVNEFRRISVSACKQEIPISRIFWNSIDDCINSIQVSLLSKSSRNLSRWPLFRLTSPFHSPLTECCKDSLTSVISNFSQTLSLGLYFQMTWLLATEK